MLHRDRPPQVAAAATTTVPNGAQERIICASVVASMYVWVARVGSGLRLVGASATRRGRSVFRPIIYNTLGGLASLARRLVNFKKEEIVLFLRTNERARRSIR